MSGGSWDYVYAKVREAAERLIQDTNPSRVALGIHLIDVAKCLRAIEWNDSGDGDDDEAPLLAKLVSPELELTVLEDRVQAVKAQFDAWDARRERR